MFSSLDGWKFWCCFFFGVVKKDTKYDHIQYNITIDADGTWNVFSCDCPNAILVYSILYIPRVVMDIRCSINIHISFYQIRIFSIHHPIFVHMPRYMDILNHIYINCTRIEPISLYNHNTCCICFHT